MSIRPLGVLELAHKPLELEGTFGSPDTFDFPLRRLTVPGAWVQSVVDGDQAVKDAYVSCARQLESEGASSITANCGLTALFQTDVAAAVSIPVALSSLLLVPLVARTLPPGKKVGIVTYDSRELGERYFSAAGWSSSEIAVSVTGIEGSETWRQLSNPVPNISADQLTKDVLVAIVSLLETDPSIGAFVFECTGFPVASDTVRRETGLLVADSANLARMLRDMSSA